MNVLFADHAWDDFTYWITHDRRIARRIVRLIKEIERDPWSGIGKPEPLKHDLAGFWSRRITDEHRDDLVDILGQIPDSEAVVLATATYEAGIFPLMAYIIDEILHKVAYEKPMLLLSTFGWGGMVSKQLVPKLEESSFQLVDAIEIKSLLDDEGRENLLAGVRKLVDAIH